MLLSYYAHLMSGALKGYNNGKYVVFGQKVIYICKNISHSFL